MNASGLRIGNLIGMSLKEFPHNIFKVLEVGQTMKVTDHWLEKDLNFKRMETQFHDIEDFEPVPLNEEWLIKFGFELMTDAGDFKGNDRWWSKHNIPGCFYLHNFRWSFGGYSTTIQYIHDLQNIIYALTGKELEIKN